MNRRFLTKLLLLVAIPALIAPARAEGDAPRFADLPPLLRPGKAERISFYSAVDMPAEILLVQGGGTEGESIFGLIPAYRGMNFLTWNGMDAGGRPIQEGEYALLLRQGEAAVRADVSVGPPAPRILSYSISDAAVTPGAAWYLTAAVNMPGLLRVALAGTGGERLIAQREVAGGSVTLQWDGTFKDGPAEAGSALLSLSLTDSGGFSSNPQPVPVTLLAAPEPSPAPAKELQHYRAPGREPSDPSIGFSGYWALPVGEWNESAIWQAMMQPVTVVTGGDQKETYKLRATPDGSLKASNIAGEITFVSQGVNVLENRPDGWSLVETFNSSYGPDCDTRPGYGNTDELISGYVRTDSLKSVTPRDDYGLLIDKLKQKLYVFKAGKLFTELVISTGLPTSRQPWNETPSGEFLMVSRVGDFNAGNLVCGMGMRINGGALIHEVPYILNEATLYKDYSLQEKQLGEKASHGCIRVQRRNNADGVNMAWLWNNIKVNTKVFVWDDFPGRYYEYPSDDLQLYYNPVGGKYYHTDRNCPSIKDRFLPLEGTMSYAELDDGAFRKLMPCFACNPPLRKSEIDEINRRNGF